MATIAVDQARTVLVSAGTVEPVQQWVDTPAGRRPSPDQVTDDSGRPLWTVWALVLGGDRPELVGVRVPAPSCPPVTPMEPVPFEELSVTVRVGRDGRLATYWNSSGVARVAAVRDAG